MTTLPDSSVFPSLGARPGSAGINIREYLVPLVVVIFVTIFLWLVSLYNFALYHTTVEFTTIAISAAIFLLVWKSRKIIDNNYLLFIGIAFIFIAILDFLHTLVYQGVGIFPDGGGTLSTRFWIAARYMQAVTLLAAPLFIRRKLRIDLVAIVYLVADVLIVASIFFFHNFPATYIQGVGLTPFKIVSEYIISLLLIASVVLLYRNRASFDRQVLNNLAIAIFLIIAAELTFTEYASFTDIFSLLGHVFRLVAYYFFYRAIIEVGQEKPYNLLYHNLNESEKKYRALSELSPDAILVVKDGIITYSNGAGLQMLGIPSMEKIIGRNFFDFIHPGDRDGYAARVAAVQEEKMNVPIREIRLIDGEKTVPVEVTDGPVSWNGKDAVQILIRDITERKKTEETLQESEERFRTIAETVPVLVCVTRTEDSIVLFTNEVNNKAFGLRGEDIIGTKGPDYYCDPADRRNMIELFGKQGYVDNYPLQVKKSDGTLFWIMTSARPIVFQGQPAIIGASIDITDRREAEEELRHRHDDLNAAYEEITLTQEELEQNVAALTKRESQLQEALAEKEVLLSEIHHRVKNNLAAFISLLSLEGTYDESPVGVSLRKDLQNRARSMALIHETLYRTRKFSTVDMGVYLATLVDQVAGSYHPERPVCTIVTADGVSLDLSRSTPCGLIVNELITNAFKYAFPASFDCEAVRGEPCTLRVSLTLDKGSYLLTVADNGIGLPRALDPLTAKSLGLKLVNFLAKHQLRASVGVNTEHGTEFSIRFAERTTQ